MTVPLAVLAVLLVPALACAWQDSDGRLQVRANKIFNVKSFKVIGNQIQAERDIPELQKPEEFDQSLRFSMLGYVSDNIQADVRFDDTRSDRVEHVYLQAEGENYVAEVGDIDVDYDGSSFLIHSRKVKGGRVRSRVGDHEVGIMFSRMTGLSSRETLEGNFTKGPFHLLHADIVSGSEIVKLDGETLKRNRDYTFDYDSGTLSFNDEVPGGVRVQVFYEYIPDDPDELTRTLIGFDGLVELGGPGGNLGLTVLRKKDGGREGSATFAPESSSSQTVIDLRHDLYLSDRITIQSEVALSENDFSSLVTDAALRDEAARVEAEIDLDSVILRLGTKRIGDDFVFLGGNNDQDCLSSKRFAILDYVPDGPFEGSLSFADNDGLEKDIVSSFAWQVARPLTVFGRAHTRRRRGDDLEPGQASKGGNIRVKYVQPRYSAETKLDRFESDHGVNDERISNNIGLTVDSKLWKKVTGHLETTARKDEINGLISSSSDWTKLSLRYRPTSKITVKNELSYSAEEIFKDPENIVKKAADIAVSYHFSPGLVTTASVGREFVKTLGMGNSAGGSQRWGLDLRWKPRRSLSLLGKLNRSSQQSVANSSSIKMTLKPYSWAKLSAEYSRRGWAAATAPSESIGAGIDLRLTQRLRALAMIDVESNRGEQFKTKEKSRIEVRYRLRPGMEFSLNFRSEGMRNNASFDDNYTARIGSFNLSAEL